MGTHTSGQRGELNRRRFLALSGGAFVSGGGRMHSDRQRADTGAGQCQRYTKVGRNPQLGARDGNTVGRSRPHRRCRRRPVAYTICRAMPPVRTPFR